MNGLWWNRLIGNEGAAKEIKPAPPKTVTAVPHTAPAPSSTPASASPAPVAQNQQRSTPPSAAPGPAGDALAAKKANPAGPVNFSYKGQTITEDTTWSGRVRIVDSVVIAQQATLFINAGTVVEAQHSEGNQPAMLLVHGRMVAQGTTDQPVIFKSAEGKDKNLWQGIFFIGSEKKNILEYCLFEGAEAGIDAAFSSVTIRSCKFSRCRVALHARDSLLYLSSSSVNNCKLGIGIEDSETEVVGGAISGSGTGISASRSSLYVSRASIVNSDSIAVSGTGCRLKIEESNFVGNGSGLSLISSEGNITGNRIVKNTDCGISLSGSRIKVSGNEISQNGRIGIHVADGKGIAWNNSIFGNGHYDVYNAGSEDFTAIGNWWGEDARVKIQDKSTSPTSGKVVYLPLLNSRPVSP